jgi:hypothetical protein
MILSTYSDKHNGSIQKLCLRNASGSLMNLGWKTDILETGGEKLHNFWMGGTVRYIF